VTVQFYYGNHGACYFVYETPNAPTTEIFVTTVHPLHC